MSDVGWLISDLYLRSAISDQTFFRIFVLILTTL